MTNPLAASYSWAKTTSTPLNIRNNTGMSTFTSLLNIVLEVLVTEIRPEKEIKSIQIGKEGVKVCLISVGKIPHAREREICLYNLWKLKSVICGSFTWQSIFINIVLFCYYCCFCYYVITVQEYCLRILLFQVKYCSLVWLHYSRP